MAQAKNIDWGYVGRNVAIFFAKFSKIFSFKFSCKVGHLYLF